MTTGASTLETLHACGHAEELALFRHQGRTMTWRQLRGDVASLRAGIAASAADDWALFHDDAYPFTVALLALLAEGRNAWLPANATAGTRSKLAAHCDAWLGPQWPQGGDIAVATDAGPAPLSELTGQVIVFTSGSTGEPQPIPKALGQLGREVDMQEWYWGGTLGPAEVLATVSHQHIYGLLFRVLWPLCSGRLSHSERFVEVRDLLGAVARTTAAAWVASPAHLRRLPPGPEWTGVRDRLRAVFSSGGPLPADTAREVAELAGTWPREIYGSSESGGIAWRTQAKGNAWWRPLPGVEVRRGDDGALALRSPHLPDDDAWMTMSDAVEIGADGCFRLGERLDRIVKVEGKRLSLPELEAALVAHPWLTEARALLLKRRRESVAVVAVPSAAGTAELEALGRHGFSRRLREALLASFDPVTLPRLWRFVEAMPADAQGKVGDRNLTALFEKPAPRRLPDTVAVTHADGARACELRLHVPATLGCVEGHFPEAAVVPGVALIGWAEHYARQYLDAAGSVRDLERVKFSHILRPGREIVLTLWRDDVRRAIGYRFRSARGGKDYASGRLLFAATGSG